MTQYIQLSPTCLDYKTGFGGQFGVQTDRVDKTAVGWDHTSAGASHESQAKQSDYKAGFVGNREAESPSPVGTNYQKTKPDSKFSFYTSFNRI